MKKLLITLLTLMFTVCFSTVSFAGIANSAHDFSGQTWNTTSEICVVCHTPHNADLSVVGAPLWNHEVTTSSYTIYDSGTLTATDVGQPDDSSKLCLSCHDGTVAVDSFGGASGGIFMASGDDDYIGTDLSDDHPISFVYSTTLASDDGSLFDPTTALSGLGGTIDDDLLISTKLQCSSCHDVHNKYDNSNLLKINNSGSALCLTCHNM